MAKKLKIAALISGRGSNLRSVVNAAKDPSYPAEIVLVISNKESALGLEFAREEGIPTLVIDHKKFLSREEFDKAMDEAIRKTGADIVCMMGFMRLLSDWFNNKWHNKLINIHPSLLPSFKGANGVAEAYKAGVKIAGCTVHYVRPEMDSGPIILQAAVPVLSGDSEADLAARILVMEHKCYPLALKLVAEGKIKIKNEKTIIDSDEIKDGFLINPGV